MRKAADAFRSIGEVSKLIGVPPHVLRYWETQFPQLAPVKRADGRRYYRPEDLHLAAGLCELLREDGMTTRGAARVIAQDRGAAVRARGLARLPERFRGEAAEAAARAEKEASLREETAVSQDTTVVEAAEDVADMAPEAAPPPAAVDAAAEAKAEAEEQRGAEAEEATTPPAPGAAAVAPPASDTAARAAPHPMPARASSPAPTAGDLPLFPGLAPAAPPPGVWLPRLAAAAEALRAMPAPRRAPAQMLRLRDRVAALIDGEG